MPKTNAATVRSTHALSRRASSRRRHVCKCTSDGDNLQRGGRLRGVDAETRQQLERDNTIILAIGT